MSCCEQIIHRGQRSGNNGRIGKKETAAWPQHTSPLAEYLLAIREVIHRINADDCIDRGIINRQSLTCLNPLKMDAILHSTRFRRSLRCIDTAFIDVDSGHVTAQRLCDEKRGTTRAAADVEHLRVCAERQLAKEPAELTGRDPAKLTDIFAIGLATNLGQNVAIKFTE